MKTEELENQIDIAILEFLKNHHHIATATIAEQIDKPYLSVNKRLNYLFSHKYVGRDRLVLEDGAWSGNRSPYLYYLITKGARFVGLSKTPSQFYRGGQHFKQVQNRETKLKLEKIIENNGYLLFSEEDREAVNALLLLYSIYLGSIRSGRSQELETQKAKEDQDFRALAEVSIHPDLLVKTEYDLILLIISHPRSYGKFLKKRIERYTPILNLLKIVVITFNERQYDNCQKFLAISTSQVRDRLYILPHEKVNLLPDLIRSTHLEYEDHSTYRRLLINWQRKHALTPPEKFELPE